jgi:hypothetical protein
MSTINKQVFYKNRDVTFSFKGDTLVKLEKFIIPEPEDADAIAFLDAAGITDPTISWATDVLVTDLKRDNIWDKMYTIYPFVGGTASTHKFNLKNPADTDAAFRLSFVGPWIHNSNGATSPGFDSNGYAETFLSPKDSVTDWGLTSSMGLYSRTSAQGNYDMGVTSFGIQTALIIRFGPNDGFYNGLPVGDGTKISGDGGDPAPAIENLDGRGFYQIVRDSPTRIWSKNGTINRKDTFVAYDSVPDRTMVIGAFKGLFGAIQENTVRNYAYGFMGEKLSDTELSKHNKAVQRFQTILGRKV